MEFYRRLKDLPQDGSVLAVTLLTGLEAGAKALWNDGVFFYQDDFSIDFECLQEDLKSGIHQLTILDRAAGRFLCEPVNRTNRLVICGAGHISIPVIQIGKMLGFKVEVLEDRPMYADHARKAGADMVICKPFKEALEDIPGGSSCYFVILTRGHRYDQDCLEVILRKTYRYIGMIGSRSRVWLVRKAMEAKGFDAAVLDGVHSPVGLHIRAETPEEIAVSIMAEIIQVKNESGGTSGFTEELLDAILSPENQGVPCAVVTITARAGSAPREAGARMLVTADGRTAGTIGGGCIEAEITAAARECARTGISRYQSVSLSQENAEDEGMVCGGSVEVLIDPVHSGI